MQKRVFQLLADNTSGVLSRICGLFSRRGYNIESITAGVTADPKYSRVTIVTSGDDESLDQIEKQVLKLVDVKDVKILAPEDSVYRELVLIKIRVTAENRLSVNGLVDSFKARIVDVSKDSMTVEMEVKGLNDSKLDNFINLLEGHEVLELARSGLIGLGRGSDNVTYLP